VGGKCTQGSKNAELFSQNDTGPLDTEIRDLRADRGAYTDVIRDGSIGFGFHVFWGMGRGQVVLDGDLLCMCMCRATHSMKRDHGT